MLESCARNTAKYADETMHKQNIYRNLLVNERYKFLICPIPKIGSSFLKTIFKILHLNLTKTDPTTLVGKGDIHSEPFPKLLDFDTTEQKKILSTYTKVMFTRDPLSRIFSAYQDKLVSTNLIYWGSGKGIIKAYRHNPSSKSLSCGHDTRFEEFLDFLIHFSENHNSDKMDIHWKPVHLQCDPCMIQYDIIGKLESFYDDMTETLRTIGAQDKIYLPKVDSLSLAIRKGMMTHEIKYSFSQLNELNKLGCISEKEFPLRVVQDFVSHGYIGQLGEKERLELSKIASGPTNATYLTKWIFKQMEKSDSSYLRNLPKETEKAAYKNLAKDMLLRLKVAYLHDFTLFGYDF
ncbi:unnamed protein product [Owenia fusiformis]|uniref:Carbohydrate sulfotransferase n=1 Tax=Owenia fusiformis TaxID=6347 RepID=A0A8J1TW35_OWEFU|nr:unnamed protein product [Owenia fusiformis]